MGIEALYAAACSTLSDINEHLPTLRKYAAKSRRILELGTRYGVSTTALLAGQPDILETIDRNFCENTNLLDAKGKTHLRFIRSDSLKWDALDWVATLSLDTPPQWKAVPSLYDLLLIDTDHTEIHVTRELGKYAPQVMRWIILHDTVSFPAVRTAMDAFLLQNPEWSLIEDHQNNNGLAVLERRQDARAAR